MKITQNIEKGTVVMLVVVQNLRVRRIFPTSDNIMGNRRDNVMSVNNKSALQVQNVVDKKNLPDTVLSTETIFIINSNSMQFKDHCY